MKNSAIYFNCYYLVQMSRQQHLYRQYQKIFNHLLYALKSKQDNNFHLGFLVAELKLGSDFKENNVGFMKLYKTLKRHCYEIFEVFFLSHQTASSGPIIEIPNNIFFPRIFTELF